MQIENRLRPDLWKAIQAHYERNDYTEAVRDTLFHVCELLRDKSGIEDKDGTKLVEATLLGSNPAILVNKNETTTEKDVQQGIGFAMKGLMQSVRNPMSHENTAYSQNDAEAIILYVNYLLEQVDHSGGYSKIDNVRNLLYDEDFTPTKEYAELLLKEIPTKKRYDLLVELFQKRSQLPEHTLKNFIEKLFDSLSKSAKADFLRLVSSSLLTCKNDKDLRMYLHYYMEITYLEIDRLAQLRIETFILRAVQRGCMERVYNPIAGEEEKECNSEGTLATWVDDPEKFQLLTDRKQLVDALISRVLSDEDGAEEYVFEYFEGIVFSDLAMLSEYQIRGINRRLLAGDEMVYNALSLPIDFLNDEDYRNLFGEAFSKCEGIIEQKQNVNRLEPLPF